jgi:hypothetical protein
MDVRTPMRSTAHDSAHREAVAAGGSPSPTWCACRSIPAMRARVMSIRWRIPATAPWWWKYAAEIEAIRAALPDLMIRDCMPVSVAPIADETALKACEAFGDAMYQGHGQTEALPIAMMGPRQRFEITGKCEGQMRGFKNKPEATGECIVDGWAKTGDVGHLDGNGSLYMLDRADDMVISVGFNIVFEVSVFGEASVTAKELVDLYARHEIRRKELREPF